MTVVVGDVVVVLVTARPETFVEMAPFIESFLAGQPG